MQIGAHTGGTQGRGPGNGAGRHRIPVDMKGGAVQIQGVEHSGTLVLRWLPRARNTHLPQSPYFAWLISHPSSTGLGCLLGAGITCQETFPTFSLPGRRLQGGHTCVGTRSQASGPDPWEDRQAWACCGREQPCVCGVALSYTIPAGLARREG